MAWREVHELPGQGLEGTDAGGAHWRLGAAAWAGAQPVDTGSAAQTLLVRDGQPLLRFAFDERLREDAAAAVAALRHDGVEVRLLSGDDAARAQRIGAMLGLASVAGAMSPDDKLAAVVAAQRRGEIVAMLGDGINDAPVLAQADVSFAMACSSRTGSVIWCARACWRARRCACCARTSPGPPSTTRRACRWPSSAGCRRGPPGWAWRRARWSWCSTRCGWHVERTAHAMDILYLLIPLSALLVLGILGVFGWALNRGQFDDLEREGERIFEAGARGFDADQAAAKAAPEESAAD
jgi:cbb3-type cytochrome oxidase maturation protein